MKKELIKMSKEEILQFLLPKAETETEPKTEPKTTLQYMKKELIKIVNDNKDEYYARIEFQGKVILCPVASDVTLEVAKEAYSKMNTQGFKAYVVCNEEGE